jgi:hypothetical protein
MRAQIEDNLKQTLLLRMSACLDPERKLPVEKEK